jgi:putative peptidoglycan lipid II flippase
MLMLNVPATVGLIVLATPIVQLLFERGRFLPADTAATASAVRLYAVGLAGYSAVRITSPAFYALSESRTPAIVSGIVILVNIAASLVLVRGLGFAGLALGTSIAAMTNAALLLWLLRARLGGLEDRRLIATLARVTVAAAVMAAAAFALQEVMERAAPGSALILRVTRLTISIGGALAVLAIAAKVLRIEEFAEAAEMVTARVRKLLDH